MQLDNEEMLLTHIKQFIRRKPFGLITRSRVHVEIGHVFNTYYYISENEDRVFKARRCLTTNSITVFDFNENIICKLKTNLYGTKYVLGDVSPFVRRYMEENNIKENGSNEAIEWPMSTSNEYHINRIYEDDNNINIMNRVKEDDNMDNRLDKRKQLNFTMADYLNYKIIENKENSVVENTKIPPNKVIRTLEIQYDTTQKDQGKPRSLEIKINELILINKKPYFNIETNSYSLNFSGRVTKPSAKNFQVIHPLDPTYITLTFGKESHDSYILDFSYPWTALHAFCVGLSALDHKYGCD